MISAFSSGKPHASHRELVYLESIRNRVKICLKSYHLPLRVAYESDGYEKKKRVMTDFFGERKAYFYKVWRYISDRCFQTIIGFVMNI